MDNTRTENVRHFNVIILYAYGQIVLKVHCVLSFSVKSFRIDIIPGGSLADRRLVNEAKKSFYIQSFI